LADALVHESIHSFLFMLEEIVGEFVSAPSELEDIRIRSPWTGSELRLDSYVHACLVWYGLYWLWSRPFEHELLSEQRRQELRDKARKGFADRPVTKGLAGLEPYMSDYVAPLLHDIEAKIFVQ